MIGGQVEFCALEKPPSLAEFSNVKNHLPFADNLDMPPTETYVFWRSK